MNRKNTFVELTTQFQGFVQRARRKAKSEGRSYAPQIHGLVYDPSTGLLDELDINLRAKAKEYGKVYDVLSQMSEYSKLSEREISLYVYTMEQLYDFS